MVFLNPSVISSIIKIGITLLQLGMEKVMTLFVILCHHPLRRGEVSSYCWKEREVQMSPVVSAVTMEREGGLITDWLG